MASSVASTTARKSGDISSLASSADPCRLAVIVPAHAGVGREGDDVVARPVIHADPVRARPRIARAPSRSRLRESTGASVATTIMMDPGRVTPCPARARDPRDAENVEVSAEVGLHQNAHRPGAVGRRTLREDGADAALPAEGDRARARADASFRRPDRSFAAASAASTCAGVIGLERIALSAQPSLVSPTTGLMDRTSSIPGSASRWATRASAAFHTQSVQVSRIGVSSSPSSRTWVTPTSFPKPLPTWSAAGTRSRNGFPPCGRMAVTPVRTESRRADGRVAHAHARARR